MTTNREIGCQGKVALPSRSRADAAIKRMARSRDVNANLQPYRCRVCGYWHVGSNVFRARRQTVQRNEGIR